jgi:hypothetical protein
MGTNYYADLQTHRITELHIGKSSAGWVFSLHVERKHTPIHPGVPWWGTPETWAGWKALLSQPSVVVRNEYGGRETFDELCALVERRPRHPTAEYAINRTPAQEIYFWYDSWVGLWRVKPHLQANGQPSRVPVIGETYDLSYGDFS